MYNCQFCTDQYLTHWIFDVLMLGQKAAVDSIPPFAERSQVAGTAMTSEAQESTTAGRNFMKMISCSQETGTDSFTWIAAISC